jgi:hypothetical protein
MGAVTQIRTNRACRPSRHATRSTASTPAAATHDGGFASSLHRLHHSIGNRAVARALRSTSAPAKTSRAQPKADGAPTAAGTNADCAKYEPNELRKSHTGAGHLATDVFIPGAMSTISKPGHLIIADYGVDWGSVPDTAAADPLLQHWINTFENDTGYWLEIEGYSDCVGAERRNRDLRQRRANKVFQLFRKARPRIRFHRAAPVDQYLTDNSDAMGRATNRSVTIRFGRTITFPGETIEAPIPKPPKPVPKPKPLIEMPGTSDCDTNQRDALARAFPLAKKMTQAAIAEIGALSPAGEALLKKYFGSKAVDHRYHIKQNFVSIRDGLNWGPVFECEEPDSWWCDGAYARVIPVVGIRIHICQSAIALGDDFLARTIIHEGAHAFAFEFGEEICAGGCPSMDTEDAESNADSYGEFGGDALTKLP